MKISAAPEAGKTRAHVPEKKRTRQGQPVAVVTSAGIKPQEFIRADARRCFWSNYGM